MRVRWLQDRFRTSLVTNMALTAFMLCMVINVVLAVGSGTVVIREPYCLSRLVSEPPDEDESSLWELLACRLEDLLLNRCMFALDVSFGLGLSDCSRAIGPFFSWAGQFPT
jgi:hypothetical protein